MMRSAAGYQLELSDVCVDIRGQRIIHHATLNIPAGTVVAVVGPNGCGKSTLLSTLYRHRTPSSGTIRVSGQNILSLPMRDSAQLVAALTQENPTDLDFPVSEVVAQGRFASGSNATRDKELCAQAMQLTGVDHLANRGIMQLSGGERQRVLLARSIAQNTPVLVLDEPGNHLDLLHHLTLLRTLRQLSRNGTTIIAAMHDVNAAMEADLVVLMNRGRIVATGPPATVLTEDAIHHMHGARPVMTSHPLSGAPRLLFDSEHSLSTKKEDR